MTLKYFIDIFKEDNTLIKALGDTYEKYRFVNFLKYVSERYDVSVVDLANILDVTRQTLYNYFKNSTKDLPIKIKNRICEIYGALDFEEVLEKEKKVEIATYNEKPHLEELARISGSGIDPSYVDGFEVYTLTPIGTSTQDLYEVRKIDKYRFLKLWRSEQRTINKKSIGDTTTTGINGIPKEFKVFLDRHSQEYGKLLIKLLNENVKEDDVEFLSYIKKYNTKGD